MKQSTNHSTIGYEPEAITKEVSASFTKITRASTIIVGGDVEKNGEKVGRLDYNKSNNLLTLSLSAVDKLTDTETAAVFKKMPECLKEILAE